MIITGAKRPDLWLFGASKRPDSLINGPLGVPGGAPKAQIWVSDAYPVHIGQLGHYVEFGTKSGAVQDLQRGKKPTIGFMETPLDQR